LASFLSVLPLTRPKIEQRHPQYLIRKKSPRNFLTDLRPRFFHQSRVTSHLLSFPNEALHSPATLPQYLVVFSLDTTALSRQNSPHQLLGSRAALPNFGSSSESALSGVEAEHAAGFGQLGELRFSLLDRDPAVRESA